MKVLRVLRVAVAALCVVAVSHPSPASAQTAADVQALQAQIDQLKKEFGDQLKALEGQLQALRGQAGAPAPQAVAPEAVAPVVEPPLSSPPPAGASKVFNPDMAVIGAFQASGGRNSGSPDPSLEMRESELSLQAVVDPYARADFFLSFGQQGVNLEEGFVTFSSLPGGLLTKVGKMRSAFGKVDGLHTHGLSWADRPLVTMNLLGGEDGLSDAGVSVARLIPAGPLFLEATGQVFRGESGDGLFAASKRSDLSYVGHLRGYRDLSESTNIDMGTSFAYGHTAAGVVNAVDVGRFTSRLVGLDATFRWRPLTQAIYHQFVGRGEFVWSRRDDFGGTQAARGFYVSGDYQFARRWFAGVRLDRSDRASNAQLTDAGQSAILTYKPSEFSLLRGQYRRTAYADGPTANEVLFQLQFAIGAHGAHPF